MKNSTIVKAELLEVALPFLLPYSTGFGTITERNTLLVRLETEDNIIGWGEAAQLSSPIYLEEWLDGSWHIIKDYLLPIIKKQGSSSAFFAKQAQQYRRHNISKFAVETALWMVEAKQQRTSYAQLLGGTKKIVEAGASIGMRSTISETLVAVEEKINLGYKRIKLKIQPGWDYEVVKSVRQKYPEIMLMVDANSSYSLSDVALLKRLDDFNLVMIEQPLSYDDIIDHAVLAKEINTPICLDESICSVEDARKAIEIGACKIINVKPARVGSLYAVRDINSLAKKHGIQLWCGGMLEGDIGKVANLAAASLSEFTLPADISDWRTYFASTCTNLDTLYKVPNFTLPESFGADLLVDEEWIDNYTVRRFSLS